MPGIITEVSLEKPQQHHEIPVEENPDNLQWLMRFLTRLVLRKPQLEGLQNLQEIPPGQHVIFAVSHISDSDMPAAASELLTYRPMDIVNLSTAHTDFIQNTGMKLTGTKGRFLGIKNTFDHVHQKPISEFSPENFVTIAQSLQKKDVMIAAHNPSKTWQLTRNPGIGAVYLAQLTGAPIIPVAVNIHSERAIGMSPDIHDEKRTGAMAALAKSIKELITGQKPEVTIHIGKPIVVSPMEEEKLSNPTREVLMELRGQGAEIMQAIAEMLPAEKRGEWNTKVSLT